MVVSGDHVGRAARDQAETAHFWIVFGLAYIDEVIFIGGTEEFDDVFDAFKARVIGRPIWVGEGFDELERRG